MPASDLKDEYEEYGILILTTAVISIVISAPLGAIMTNTFGPKWLHNDLPDIKEKIRINPRTASMRIVEEPLEVRARNKE